ncbi:MAG: PucR family transcriptional regulator [Trebonia sp.]
MSDEVKVLFQRAAEEVLLDREAWADGMFAAILRNERVRELAHDSSIREMLREANMATLLHWVTENLERPGARVTPDERSAMLDGARELVRRGLEETTLDAHRRGQSAAWQQWMQVCFRLTDDAALLRKLLEISALSMSAYVDDALAAVAERIEAEREELTHGSDARRRSAVGLIIEGAPVAQAKIEADLGYRLSGRHTAAVIWSPPGSGTAPLEVAAEAIMSMSGARRRLTVAAGSNTLWIWLATGAAPPPGQVAAHLRDHPQVRVALGRPGSGGEGFRRSHLDAIATQRLLALGHVGRAAASFEDIHLMAVLSQEHPLVDEFLSDTLGPLRQADDATREAVRVYVRTLGNGTRAAESLFTHRNTLMRRVARAEALLPRPLEESAINVAVALEILHWRGDER